MLSDIFSQFNKIFLAFKEGIEWFYFLLVLLPFKLIVKLASCKFFYSFNLKQMPFMRINNAWAASISNYLWCEGMFICYCLVFNEFGLFFPIIKSYFIVLHFNSIQLYQDYNQIDNQSNYCTYCTYNMIEQSMSPQLQTTPNSKNRRVAIEQTSEENREFNKEDIVWVKIVGYPWWPAMISQKNYPKYMLDKESELLLRNQVIYRVDFFGQPSHAFLDQSKMVDYRTNKQYFVEMAQKQHKKYDIQLFNTSITIADLMSKDPFQSNLPNLMVTPKKKREIKEEKIAIKNGGSNQTIKKRKKKDSDEGQQWNFKLAFNVTEDHIKLSRFLLRLFMQKNDKKYSMRVLKQVIIKSLKQQKCIKKIDNSNIIRITRWIKTLKNMHIDQIVAKYHPHSIQNTPTQTSSTKSYIYIDQLGIQSRLSEALERYDFYIDL